MCPLYKNVWDNKMNQHAARAGVLGGVLLRSRGRPSAEWLYKPGLSHRGVDRGRHTLSAHSRRMG